MNNFTKVYLGRKVYKYGPFAIHDVSATKLTEFVRFLQIHETMTRWLEFVRFLKIHEIMTKWLEVACILIALSAYIFLIFVIVKFQKLRSSRMNRYILHAAILYTIQTPMTLLLFSLKLELYVVPVLAQTYVTVLTLYMLFGFLLGLDCLIITKKPHCSEIFNKYQILFIEFIYITSFLELAVTFWYAKIHHIIRMHLLFFIYIFVLICSIILNVVEICLKILTTTSNTGYAFTCCNLIVFSLVPLFVHYFLFLAFKHHYIILLTSFIPKLFFILHPIILVYLLGKNDKQFRVAYYKSFAFMRMGYQGEEEENSDSKEMKVNSTEGFLTHSDERIDPTEGQATHEVDLRPAI